MSTERKTVHNLIILDESGSMGAIKDETISGFNELVQSIRRSQEEHPGQQHLVTLVTFNGTGIRSLIIREPVAGLQPLDAKRYQPDSMTPLLDAIGLSCIELEKNISEPETSWCLVTILTDGMENASQEYSVTAIEGLIKRLSAGNWTFTYIGANHDVARTSAELNIHNHLVFNSSKDGTSSMWEKERMSRINFARKVSSMDDPAFLKRDYFSDAPKPESGDKPDDQPK